MDRREFLAGLSALPIAGQSPTTQDIVSYNSPDVLKGIKSLSVLVSTIPEDMKMEGVTRDALETAVELPLRMSGLKVLSGEEIFKLPLVPLLFVNIAGKVNGPLLQWAVDLELKEIVYPNRNRNRAIAGAVTWRRESSGTVGKAKVDQFREPVRDLVDQFLNDYLKANPKKAGEVVTFKEKRNEA
jgi:hypothetical protein